MFHIPLQLEIHIFMMGYEITVNTSHATDEIKGHETELVCFNSFIRCIFSEKITGRLRHKLRYWRQGWRGAQHSQILNLAVTVKNYEKTRDSVIPARYTRILWRCAQKNMCW